MEGFSSSSVFNLGQYLENCYIFSENGSCCVIDPGLDNDEIIKNIQSNLSSLPLKILLTHAHYDHIGGVPSLMKHFDAKIYLHEDEVQVATSPFNNGSFFKRPAVDLSEFRSNFVLLKDGDEFEAGGTTLKCIHITGHTPGGLFFVDSKHSAVFCGDSVMSDGTLGKTSYRFGNKGRLTENVKRLISTLPHDYILYPGHLQPIKVSAALEFPIFK